MFLAVNHKKAEIRDRLLTNVELKTAKESEQKDVKNDNNIEVDLK
jgi:hypothetical protein